MRSLLRAAFLAGVLAVFAPDHLTAQVGEGANATRERTPRRGRGPITLEELVDRTDANLHSAIRALRPSWLRTSGGPYAHVYVGNVSLGDLRELENIGITTVERVEYFAPAAAMARYGLGHEGGVILVHLKQ